MAWTEFRQGNPEEFERMMPLNGNQQSVKLFVSRCLDASGAVQRSDVGVASGACTRW